MAMGRWYNMTREEAITIINNLHLIGCGRNQHENDLKRNEAIDMAIDALSTKTDGEYINKADAIDLVLTYFIPRSHTGERGYYEEDFVRTIFKSLPSADVVSREEYDDVKAYMEKLVDAFIEDGEELVDSVKVVRCMDCCHQVHCHQTVGHTKIHDDFKEYWAEEIDFCSRGKRKNL